MNTKTILNIYITIMLFFGVFGFAYSAEYTVLSPLPGTTSSCSGETCKSNLEKYLPGFFKLLIGVGAGLGFVMLTYEGFQYVLTDSFPVKSNARGKIQDILTGLGLIICSYAILYTINPRTLNLRLDLPSVAQISNNLKLLSEPNQSLTTVAGTNEASVRDLLKIAGVDINAGPCSTGQTRGCTNVYGISSGAITTLASLKQNCNCNIMLTGGTEDGHQTHGVGRDVVDLSPNPDLHRFLGVSGTPTDGRQVIKEINGRNVTFTYEVPGGNPSGTSTGHHWHVKIQ